MSNSTEPTGNWKRNVGGPSDDKPTYLDPFLESLRDRGAAGQVVNLADVRRANLDPFRVTPRSEGGRA
ncbi:hypothetical protein [Janibacter terrae]|uniref:hypothetical protein n=1 Tax=Janibacter terrae TaxID=103817 RepID=UPI000AC6AEF4|nr:hypothetical protein [Janibacter terrae]